MSEPRHIYRCIFGSRLYGTALPTSDYDTKGVFLPTRDEILLCQPPKTWTAPAEEGDSASYSLQRFLELLAEGQTVALDMLFAPPDAWKMMDPYWTEVQRVSPFIMNRKCGSAVGYARAQAQKYSLRGSRITALEVVLDILRKYPKHSDQVQDALFAGGSDLAQQPESVARYISTSKWDEHSGVAFLEVCDKKVGINCTVKTAITLFEKQLAEYGERSKEAQAGGADWKALYHAVRITEQTVELLQTGHITFPRPNAADLLKIRAGLYSPMEVYDRIEAGIARINEAQAASDLPDEADTNLMRKLVRDIHLEIVTQ
jgi:hypothetical protein